VASFTVPPDTSFRWINYYQFVLRGGYGISYIHFNRLGGENLLSYNGPNIISNSVTQQVTQPLCTGNNFLGCFRKTEQGYPEGFVAPERFNPLTARVNFTPRDTRTAYVQSWHLTVQHELPWKLLVDGGYVGNRSNKLIILADYNQARPNNASDPAAGTPLQQRRPFPAIRLSRPRSTAVSPVITLCRSNWSGASPTVSTCSIHSPGQRR
jgi:hypothetical protein